MLDVACKQTQTFPSVQPFSPLRRDSSVGAEPPPGGAGRETDLEEADSLQYLQLSLPQFAATVLQQTLHSLRTVRQAVATELLRLGFESWKILAVVVADEVWTSGSESAKELVSWG